MLRQPPKHTLKIEWNVWLPEFVLTNFSKISSVACLGATDNPTMAGSKVIAAGNDLYQTTEETQVHGTIGPDLLADTHRAISDCAHVPFFEKVAAGPVIAMLESAAARGGIVTGVNVFREHSGDASKTRYTLCNRAAETCSQALQGPSYAQRNGPCHSKFFIAAGSVTTHRVSEWHLEELDSSGVVSQFFSVDPCQTVFTTETMEGRALLNTALASVDPDVRLAEAGYGYAIVPRPTYALVVYHDVRYVKFGFATAPENPVLVPADVVAETFDGAELLIAQEETAEIPPNRDLADYRLMPASAWTTELLVEYVGLFLGDPLGTSACCDVYPAPENCLRLLPVGPSSA